MTKIDLPAGGLSRRTLLATGLAMPAVLTVRRRAAMASPSCAVIRSALRMVLA